MNDKDNTLTFLEGGEKMTVATLTNPVPTTVPVTVTVADGVQWVDARELHGQLGIQTKFADWVGRNFGDYVEGEDYAKLDFSNLRNQNDGLDYSKMCDQEGEGFFSNLRKTVEGEDFSPILAKTPTDTDSGGRPRKDYRLTLNMAKHLALMAKTEEGRRVRQYLIEAEKELRRRLSAPALSDVDLLARAVIVADKHLAEAKAINAQLTAQNTALNTRIEAVRAAINTDIAPKLEYYTRAHVTHQNHELKLSETAKVLKLEFSNIGLYKVLREWGWVMAKSTEPTQMAINQGLLVAKESTSLTPDKNGVYHGSIVTYTTLKGRVRMLERLLSEGKITRSEAIQKTVENLRRMLAIDEVN